MRKNMFWVVAFSCLPGLGHMYIGYTRRGVAIMGTFFAIVALTGWLSIPMFGFILPVLWCYSMFDAIKINRADGQGVADDFWIYRSYSMHGRAAFLFGSQAKWIGWVLVLIGASFIYQEFLSPVLYELFGDNELARRLVYNFPSLVVSFAAIYLGIQLIRPNRAARLGAPKGDDNQ